CLQRVVSTFRNKSGDKPTTNVQTGLAGQLYRPNFSITPSHNNRMPVSSLMRKLEPRPVHGQYFRSTDQLKIGLRISEKFGIQTNVQQLPLVDINTCPR